MLKKLFVLTLFLSISIFAQDEKKTQLFFVHEDIVKPNMVSKYEEASKGFVELFKELKISRNSHASMTEELSYFYLTPIENYSAIDAWQKEWETATKNAPEGRMEEAYSKYDDCYDIHKDYIVRKHNDLSYWPEDARVKRDEIKFLSWTKFWFKDGSGKEFTELAKKFKKAYEDNGVKDGYSIYSGDIGMDRNYWIVVSFGKDAADFYTQRSINRSILNDKVKDLRAGVRAITLKRERMQGWTKPELSYTAEK